MEEKLIKFHNVLMEEVSNLSKQLKCTICSKYLNHPRIVSCGHKFCLRCLEEEFINKEKWKCSICDSSVDKRSIIVDYNKDKLIDAFLPLEKELQSIINLNNFCIGEGKYFSSKLKGIDTLHKTYPKNINNTTKLSQGSTNSKQEFKPSKESDVFYKTKEYTKGLDLSFGNISESPELPTLNELYNDVLSKQNSLQGSNSLKNKYLGPASKLNPGTHRQNNLGRESDLSGLNENGFDVNIENRRSSKLENPNLMECDNSNILSNQKEVINSLIKKYNDNNNEQSSYTSKKEKRKNINTNFEESSNSEYSPTQVISNDAKINTQFSLHRPNGPNKIKRSNGINIERRDLNSRRSANPMLETDIDDQDDFITNNNYNNNNSVPNDSYLDSHLSSINQDELKILSDEDYELPMDLENTDFNSEKYFATQSVKSPSKINIQFPLHRSNEKRRCDSDKDLKKDENDNINYTQDTNLTLQTQVRSQNIFKSKTHFFNYKEFNNSCVDSQLSHIDRHDLKILNVEEYGSTLDLENASFNNEKYFATQSVDSPVKVNTQFSLHRSKDKNHNTNENENDYESQIIFGDTSFNSEKYFATQAADSPVKVNTQFSLHRSKDKIKKMKGNVNNNLGEDQSDNLNYTQGTNLTLQTQIRNENIFKPKTHFLNYKEFNNTCVDSQFSVIGQEDLKILNGEDYGSQIDFGNTNFNEKYFPTQSIASTAKINTQFSLHRSNERVNNNNVSDDTSLGESQDDNFNYTQDTNITLQTQARNKNTFKPRNQFLNYKESNNTCIDSQFSEIDQHDLKILSEKELELYSDYANNNGTNLGTDGHSNIQNTSKEDNLDAINRRLINNYYKSLSQSNFDDSDNQLLNQLNMDELNDNNDSKEFIPNKQSTNEHGLSSLKYNTNTIQSNDKSTQEEIYTNTTNSNIVNKANIPKKQKIINFFSDSNGNTSQKNKTKIQYKSDNDSSNYDTPHKKKHYIQYNDTQYDSPIKQKHDFNKMLDSKLENSIQSKFDKEFNFKVEKRDG